MTGLADALRAEHAAVFGYGVVGSHVSKSLARRATRAERAHRKLRDELLRRLEDRSATPPAAEPAYRLPFEVTDSEQALALAIHLEERVAAVWRAALGGTTGADRELALDALVDAAVRASHWRSAAGKPATVPLPGSPD